MSTPPRTLVVFHSRTGHTRQIGRLVATKLGADVEEITLPARAGTPSYARCAVGALLRCADEVKAARHDPAAYDLVLVGTPVWFWSLPAPVRGWLEAYPLGGAQVAFFCTMGGSGAARVFAQMRGVCGKRPRATLALTEAQVAAGPQAAIDAFVARLSGLRGATARPAARRTRAEAAEAASAPTARAGKRRRAHSQDARSATG